MSHRLAGLIGSVHWNPPPWFTRVKAALASVWRALSATRTRGLITVATLLAVAAGSYWYVTRPQPHYVTFDVSDPPLTTYNERGAAEIHPLTITFSESAAP